MEPPATAAHPGQSEVHLHLGHPLAHAGPHPHPEGDEAVGVVLGAAGQAPPPRALGAEPALRQEELRVGELVLVVTDDVVAQVELGLGGGRHCHTLVDASRSS